MTWRNDRTGIHKIKLDLGAKADLDVLVEFDDSSDVRRATVVGNVYGVAKTSDNAKLALADRLERLASLIRNDVIDRSEKKREERKSRGRS